MEYEEEDDHDEEMDLEASYDSLGNSVSRIKMPSEEPEALLTQSITQAQQQIKPRYRECLKNHAVVIGGYALDGCGEFMPAGADSTLDALKCAACNCHRNFHRKETYPLVSEKRPVGVGEPYSVVPPHHCPPQPQFTRPYYRTPGGYLHLAPHYRPMALPSTSGGRGSHSRDREEQEDMSNPSGGVGGVCGFLSGSKKRHRTKFTQEQKEKMLDLAERLGWRIQKQDEGVVQHFCNETGVKRHVLKVWMHNNKHTLGKKPLG